MFQWQELLNSRPDVNSEDPDEVAAIKEAEENIGDYKLKSSSDYVVPDHLRMNTEKARIKLVILKELVSECWTLKLKPFNLSSPDMAEKRLCCLYLCAKPRL